MRTQGFYTNERLGCREQVFDTVIHKIEFNKVLYLEFGVKYGDSIKYWSKKLKNPNSILHGFDSFEGLPEAWDYSKYTKGHLSTDGVIPNLNDPRVFFFKGWFKETLPNYNIPSDYDNLVIMLDADLYSSTIYVLNHFKEYIKKGTYIFFDDMNRPEHEPKAFNEFMVDTGLKFQLISTDYALNRCFFICTGEIGVVQ